jgi:6-phosphogluconolactonase
MFHPHEHRFPDAGALTQTLAGELRVNLQAAIEMRGAVSFAVSGGRTPAALFTQLANEVLPWNKVWVTLVDERWVEVSDEASNERMVRNNLLQSQAAAAQFIGLKNAAATPDEGSESCWRSLSKVPRPFDIVLLGMGDDGHTASLFPNGPELSQALSADTAAACVATEAPVAPQARISLNVSALLDSRRIVVLIQGETKWAVYQRARAIGPAEEMPIRAVLQQQVVPVEVFWSP